MNSWQQTWDELLNSTAQTWGPLAGSAEGTAANLIADPDIAALYAQIAQKGEAWLRFAEQAIATWPNTETQADWHTWVDQFTGKLELAWGDDFRHQTQNWLNGLTHWLQGLRQVAATTAPWMQSMPVPGWSGAGRGDDIAATVERAQMSLTELAESTLKLTNLLTEMQQNAVKQFNAQLHDLVGGEVDVDSVEALFDLWTEQREESYRILIRNPNYRQSFADCCNAWSALHLHAGQIAAQLARLMNLPSREELHGLRCDYRALRREFDALREQLDAATKAQQDSSA
jgi:hypothetical protein